MTEPSTSRSLRFGVFDLDLRTGELRKSGVRLKLDEQPFRILRALVLASGDLVTRQQLQDDLWPDESFGDLDHRLNAAVKRLRDTLSDSATAPRYVETLPKKGYRFVAPVEAVEDEKPSPPEPPPSPTPHPVRRYSLIAAGIGLAAVLAYLLRPQPQFPSNFTERRLTYSPGQERSPSISPDGTRVAYTWDGDVYVRYLDAASGEPIRVTETPEEEWDPAWSPDGAKLVFARILESRRIPFDTRYKLVITSPAQGSPETDLGDFVHRGRAVGPAWSPSGEYILFSCRTTPESEGGPTQICALSLATREWHEVSSPSSAVGDLRPSFSPDGGSIAYTTPGGLAVLALTEDMHARSEPVRLSENLFFPEPAGWLASGQEIVIASRLWTGEQGFWRIAPTAGAEPQLIWRARVRNATPALWQGPSHDVRIVYAEESERAQILRVDLRDPTAPSIPLSRSTGMDFNPQFSPDGKQVAFMSDRTGPFGIWLCDLDDCENPDLLIELPPFAGLSTPRWSPQGDRIVVDAIYRAGGRQAYIIDVASQRAGPALTDQGGRWPSWSRDEKSIYYIRGANAGIWKQDLAGGEVTPFVGGHGNAPMQESPDGNLLYFIDNRTLMRVRIQQGAARGQPERVAEQVVAFAPVGRGVYLREASGAVLFLEDGDDDPTEIMQIPADDSASIAGIAVSPDERWLLYTDRKPPEYDIKLLESLPER